MEIANSQEYYDKMLKDAIQKLNSLKSVCGGEGVAYFLDDNFVIKEFTNKKDMFTFNATFNAYVEDLKWAREEGVNMPKIYSHLKLEDKTRKWPYRYFILEERFKYDNIFPNYITEFYGDCKDVCSASEFGEILHNPDQNKGIYREILNTVRNFLVGQWLGLCVFTAVSQIQSVARK